MAHIKADEITKTINILFLFALFAILLKCGSSWIKAVPHTAVPIVLYRLIQEVLFLGCFEIQRK